jgi:carbamoyl-phosphate synthase small subunit
MSMFHRREVSLILENGAIFTGERFGAEGETYGEIIFNTAMTGYQEVLSDPSYAEQIILFTFPHIGNVGVNLEDQESKFIWAKGVIVRNFSHYYSNWRATGSLENYLVKNNIIGISEIDTRSLTTTLRTHGSLWGCISSEKIHINEALLKIKEKKKSHDAVRIVSSRSVHNLKTKNNKYHVLVYDFGIKNSIINKLREVECDITVVPWDTNYKTALAFKPDGIVLSNGPGDPQKCDKAIEATRVFLQEDIPILGICLGHQILCLASNATVYKMKYGHHGANHPVYDVDKRRVSISSQNHDFAVAKNSLSQHLRITHYSLFDGSVQGIKHTQKPAIGFQGHPEANPGPHDLVSIFQEFIELINQRKYVSKEKFYA